MNPAHLSDAKSSSLTSSCGFGSPLPTASASMSALSALPRSWLRHANTTADRDSRGQGEGTNSECTEKRVELGA